MGGLAKVMGGMGGGGGGGNPMDMLGGGGGMPSPGGGGGASALPIAGPMLEGVMKLPTAALGAATKPLEAATETVSSVAPKPKPGG